MEAEHGGKRKEIIWELLFCALISAVMIGICSRSSPLYPFNDWNDDNCFFTVGKAMFSGKVVYRDIYEQKGVLLYFLFGLAGLVSRTDFLGVYILETASFAVFLFLVQRSARLYTGREAAWAILPGFAAVVCSSYCFFLGGSAEQLSLPLIYLPLYSHLLALKRRREIGGSLLPPPRQIAVLGFAAGCLLWIKYTLLGIYAGYVMFIAVYLPLRREFTALFKASGIFLLGVFAATLPWLIYFGVNGAMDDAFKAYFYNNIFRYNAVGAGGLSNLWSNVRNGLLWNGRLTLAAAIGVLAAVALARDIPWLLGGACMYLCAAAAVFSAGMCYDYYPMALAPLAAPGVIFLAWLLEKALRRLPRPGGRARPLIAAALLALLTAGGGAFAFRHSINTPYISRDKDSMWYTRFAATICAAEDRSQLCYGQLDLGLYTLTDTTPQNRFFCTLNLGLPEMHEEMESSVRERRTEFLVTTRADDPLVNENYELIDSEESYFQFDRVPMSYYLYRRKN